ncbi:hypothetical protein PTSG_00289 [Salpingoeca rosetta]|uniref:ABM domain-containing protein n=1 Tax=Salpingoeca rosetta (strain ATCC 50818 / BSB-021) TaxID=946362 RepID=F2TW22_SALR5|nr:uncharacterized protein PTSG_00289 [Salpingoeca rosetta]EGD72268.1 hypothetical protein PTSG_00289 [Salpingoeca rosetta]|eukprot:XP_004998839.1 hypothetical protein PTSG_00289 [Salpingoeca rosetta]
MPSRMMLKLARYALVFAGGIGIGMLAHHLRSTRVHPHAFVFIVRLKFKPGAVTAFVERWAALASHCRQSEENTLTYELCYDLADEDTVMIYERYCSKADLTNIHNKSAPFARLNRWLASANIVLEREVLEYQESNIGYIVRR